MRHEGFSFYGPRKSDEGGDTDLIYNFFWPYITEIQKLLVVNSGNLTNLSQVFELDSVYIFIL